MKKLISILTTLCFMVSVIGTDIAHAIPTNDRDAQSIENSMSFIPFNLGRVIESKTFDNSRYTVINIQDLHCHIEAQKNIEQIIENLQKNYKISAIFVEGGYDEVDTSIFGRVKDEKLRNNIIEGLFEKGRLTGAEYYYLKNDVKTPFYGLEDKSVHQANLERLSAALNNNGKYSEMLSEIKSEIEYLKAKYFSRENHRFTNTFESYKYGNMSVERYYALLRKYIDKLDRDDEKYHSLLSVSSEKYPVFKAYCELLKAGKRIDYNKATFEMQSLVNHLKDNLSYNEYNKLSLATAGFSNIEELSLRLPALSKKYGININEGSSLGELIAYIEASRNINPVEMLDEERRIAEDIRVAFSSGAEELEVSFLSDFYIYLEAFLNTKITADDYEFFAKEYPQFEKIYSKYAFKNTLAELKEDIRFLADYYAVNKDRNAIFVKNIEKRLNKNADNEVVIVVTGGFHSAGLNKIFNRDHTSYISVMPSVTQETKTAEESYNSFLAMGNVFSFQTLALALASQAHRAEIAQMMINIAAAGLSDLPYNKENIAFIIESISEALGEKIDYNFYSDNTSVTLSNGFQINLKNANGKIESSAFTNNEILNENNIRVTDFLFKGVAGTDIFDKIPAFENISTGIFNPQVSKIVANIAAIAAKRNLITGDGLIFDIETNYDLPEKLGDYEQEDLRKMPERIQQAILKAYERDEQMNSEERILARVFLAAYDSLGLDKAVLNVIYSAESSESEGDHLSSVTAHISASGSAKYDISDISTDKDSKMLEDLRQGKLLELTLNQKDGEDFSLYLVRIAALGNDFAEKAVSELLKDLGIDSELYKNILSVMMDNSLTYENNYEETQKMYIHIDVETGALTVISDAESSDSESGTVAIPKLGEFNAEVKELSDGQYAHVARFGAERAKQGSTGSQQQESLQGEVSEKADADNIFTDSAGRTMTVTKLTQESSSLEKKEKTEKFNAYRALMEANRSAMSAVGAADMDKALKYLGDMIEALELMDSATASRVRDAYNNIEKDWTENRDVSKHLKLNDQWSTEFIEQISEIHTLINAAHQQGVRRLMSLSKGGRFAADYKYSASYGSEYRPDNREINVVNYSEGEITPQLKEFISNILHTGNLYHFSFQEFHVSGNIIICSAQLGGSHNVEIVVDLDSPDDGIISAFYDPMLGRAAAENNVEESRIGRIFGLASVLKNSGFNITDYKIASGIQVRYSAKDTQNILSEYAEKFFTVASYWIETEDRDSFTFRFGRENNDDGRTSGYGRRVNMEASKLTASDFQNDSPKLRTKVLRGYVDQINAGFCRLILEQVEKAKNFFKPFYEALEISESRQSPEEIERYIAEGRATVDFKVKKAKLNERYNPYEKITEAFAEFEDAKKDKARDLLMQGYAIDNLPYEDLFLRPEAIIGDMEVKSGWLKLQDGRKLSVKVLTKRWESSIEAAYAEIVDANGKRSEIKYAELKELLEAEGYKVTEKKFTNSKSDKELEGIINGMRQEPDLGAEQDVILKGTAFAKGTGEWVKGNATYDIDSNSEGKILVKQIFSPDDVEKAGRGEGIIVMRGSEVMHSAISYKGKENKTGIIKFGRWENGRLVLSYTKAVSKTAVESNGYNVLQAEEGRLEIREGETIQINGATGEIVKGSRSDKAASIDVDARIRQIETESNVLKKYTLAQDLIAELEKAGIDNAAAKEILRQSEQTVREIAWQKLAEIKALLQKDSLSDQETEQALRLIDEAEYWKNYYGNKEIEAAVKDLSVKIEQKKEAKTDIINAEKLRVNDASVYGSKNVGAGFLYNIVKKVSDKVGVKIFAPKGIAVGKNIFERYMEGTGIADLLKELEIAKKNNNKEAAIAVGSRIQKLIRETNNEKVKKEIIKALGLKAGVKYAARSSGVGEDGKENAFAGMGNSYLNLSADEVFEHILKVWESFYSDRSVSYMTENGLDVMPAVLVQEMAEKVERSGVVLNGVIGAVFGGGEGIVSGSFSGDMAQVAGGEIRYVKAQGRKGKIVNDERGGTKEVVLDKAERGSRVLTEAEVILLDSIRIELENELGYLVDIEWAIDESGNMHILQVRPVTDFVQDYEVKHESATEQSGSTQHQEIAAAEKEAAAIVTEQVSAETENLIVKRVKASGVERFDIGMFDGETLSEAELKKNTEMAIAAIEGNKLLSMTFKRKEGESLPVYYKRLNRNLKTFSLAVDPAFLKGYPRLRGKSLSISEIVRNAFAHGNRLDGEKYSYIFISDAKHSLTVINENQSDPFDKTTPNARLAKKNGIYGQELGTSLLEANEHGEFVKRPSDNPVVKLSNGKEIFEVEFIIDNDFPPFVSQNIETEAQQQESRRVSEDQNSGKIISDTEKYTEEEVLALIEKRISLVENKPLVRNKDRAVEYQKEISHIDRAIADNMDKVSSKVLRSAYTKQEIAYLDILKNRNNKGYLNSVINDQKRDLKHKVFAVMFLKAAGETGDFDALLDSFEESIRKRSFRVKNSFDLMGMLTGAQMLLERKNDFFRFVAVNPVEKGAYSNIYEKISEAAYVNNKKENGYTALSTFLFNEANFADVLHELGHASLHEYVASIGMTRQGLQINTLDELFADATAELYGDLIGGAKKFNQRYQSHSTFRISFEGMKDGLYGKEYKNSHYFMRRINNFHKAKGIAVDWALVQRTIIEYFEEYNAEKFEDPVWEEFFDMYADNLSFAGIDIEEGEKLELASTKRIADNLGLKNGWVRGLLAGVLEFPKMMTSLPIQFVLSHYGDENNRGTVGGMRDEAFFTRLKGAQKIIFTSWILSAAAITFILTAGLTAAWAIAIPVIYNIFSHAYHNVRHPDAALELGSIENRSEKIAEFLLASGTENVNLYSPALSLRAAVERNSLLRLSFPARSSVESFDEYLFEVNYAIKEFSKNVFEAGSDKDSKEYRMAEALEHMIKNAFVHENKFSPESVYVHIIAEKGVMQLMNISSSAETAKGLTREQIDAAQKTGLYVQQIALADEESEFGRFKKANIDVLFDNTSQSIVSYKYGEILNREQLRDSVAKFLGIKGTDAELSGYSASALRQSMFDKKLFLLNIDYDRKYAESHYEYYERLSGKIKAFSRDLFGVVSGTPESSEWFKMAEALENGIKNRFNFENMRQLQKPVFFYVDWEKKIIKVITVSQQLRDGEIDRSVLGAGAGEAAADFGFAESLNDGFSVYSEILPGSEVEMKVAEIYINQPSLHEVMPKILSNEFETVQSDKYDFTAGVKMQSLRQSVNEGNILELKFETPSQEKSGYWDFDGLLSEFSDAVFRKMADKNDSDALSKALRYMLADAIVNGNKLNFDKPVYLHIDYDAKTIKVVSASLPYERYNKDEFLRAGNEMLYASETRVEAIKNNGNFAVKQKDVSGASVLMSEFSLNPVTSTQKSEEKVFGSSAEDEGISQQDNARLTLSLLKPLVSLLKFFGASEKQQQTAVAVFELPLVMVAAISPAFNETFIKWHRSTTAEQVRARQWGMTFIRRSMSYAWNASARRATSNSLIIRNIQRAAFGIAGVFSANIKAHVKYNLEHPGSQLNIGSYRQLSLFNTLDQLLVEREGLLSDFINRTSEIELLEDRLNYINQKIADSDFADSDLKGFYSDKEIEYLKIIKIRNDESGLTAFINDSDNISLRLFALSYLIRLNGDYASDSLGVSLKNEFEGALLSGQLTIENKFDQIAVLTGYNLIAAGFLADYPGGAVRLSPEDIKRAQININKKSFFASSKVPLNNPATHAAMFGSVLGIMNRSIRGLNIDSSKIADALGANISAKLNALEAMTEAEAYEEEGETFIVFIEERYRDNGNPVYIATDNNDQLFEVSEAEYLAYQESLLPSEEREHFERLVAEAEAEEARIKAEWETAKKEVSKYSYKIRTSIPAATGSKTINLPDGNRIVINKIFRDDGYSNKGFFSATLYNAAGRTIKSSGEIMFYNSNDRKGEKITYTRKDSKTGEIIVESPTRRFGYEALLLMYSSGKTQDGSKLTLPILKPLLSLLKLAKASEDTIETVVAVIELPFIMLASRFPMINNLFIWLHFSKTKEQKETRERGMEFIKRSMSYAWAMSAQRITNTNPLIRAIQRLTFGIGSVFSANIKAHKLYNLRNPGAKLSIISPASTSKSLLERFVANMKIWDKQSVINFLSDVDRGFVGVSADGFISDLLKDEAMRFLAIIKQDINYDESKGRSAKEELIKHLNSTYNMNLSLSSYAGLPVEDEYKLVIEIYKKELDNDLIFKNRFADAGSDSNVKIKQYLEENQISYYERDRKLFLRFKDESGNQTEVPLDSVLNSMFDGEFQPHRKEVDSSGNIVNVQRGREGFLQLDFRKVMYKDDSERMQALQWIIVALNDSYQKDSLLLPVKRRGDLFKSNDNSLSASDADLHARIENLLHFISKDFTDPELTVSPIRFFSQEKYEETREMVRVLDKFFRERDDVAGLFKKGVKIPQGIEFVMDLDIMQPADGVIVGESEDGKYIFCIGKAIGTNARGQRETRDAAYVLVNGRVHGFYLGIEAKDTVFRLRGIIPNLSETKDIKQGPQRITAINTILYRYVKNKISQLYSDLIDSEIESVEELNVKIQENLSSVQRHYKGIDSRGVNMEELRNEVQKLADIATKILNLQYMPEKNVISFAVENNNFYYDIDALKVIFKKTDKTLDEANAQESFIEYWAGKFGSFYVNNHELLVEASIQKIMDNSEGGWLDRLVNDGAAREKFLSYIAKSLDIEIADAEKEKLMEIAARMAAVQKAILDELDEKVKKELQLDSGLKSPVKMLNDDQKKIIFGKINARVQKNYPFYSSIISRVLRDTDLGSDNITAITALLDKILVQKFNVKKGDLPMSWAVRGIKNSEEEKFRGNILPFNFAKVATLPSTKKIIEERGYKGAVKYLYTGAKELLDFIFRSPMGFAKLHDDLTEEQQTGLAGRLGVLKAVVFSLSFISILAVSFFFPPVAAAVPLIQFLAAPVITAVLSVTFFGITVHALNNFIEDIKHNMKLKTFALFSMKEIEEKIQTEVPVNLAEEVSLILKNGREIEHLFKNPDIYKNGNELKIRLQRLIEFYYLRSISEGNKEIEESLIRFVFRFYKTIDSLTMQEGMIFQIEREGAGNIDQARYDMLKYYYSLNANAFNLQYDDVNFAHRASNQRRILRYLLTYDDLNALEKSERDLSSSGDIQEQIYKNAYLETMNDIPDAYYGSGLAGILSEYQTKLLSIALKDDITMRYFIKDIYDMGIPAEIGYMNIKSVSDKKYLYEELLLDKTMSVEYRIYALLRLAAIESNPFSITSDIENLLDMLSSGNKDEFIITKEVEDGLRDGAVKVLDKAVNKSLTGNNYLDSLEAEMLFAAEAVSLHEKYPEIDIVEFLKQLKLTFVNNGDVEFAVKYNNTGESEHVRFSMEDRSEYINSIRVFVENIYKRNMGEAVSNDKKVKTVSKAAMTFLKIIKKSSTLALSLALAIMPFLVGFTTVESYAATNVSQTGTMITMYSESMKRMVELDLSGSNWERNIPYVSLDNAANSFLLRMSQQSAFDGTFDGSKNNLGKMKIKMKGLTREDISPEVYEMITSNLKSIPISYTSNYIDDIVVIYNDSGEVLLMSSTYYKNNLNEYENADIEVFSMDYSEGKDSEYAVDNAVKAAILKDFKVKYFDSASFSDRSGQDAAAETGESAVISQDDGKASTGLGERLLAFASAVLGFAIFAALLSKVRNVFKKNDGENKINIDYTFLKDQIAVEELESIITQEKNGDISLPLYMINSMPSNKKAFNFKNTGVKINGKSVWMSSDIKALVIFAEGAQQPEIEAAVKNNSRKIRRVLSKFIKQTGGISLKGEKISLDWINVNFEEGKTSFNYDENGDIKLNFSAEDTMFDSWTSNYMTGVREIRDADTLAAIQNIYYFLDNVKTKKDLEVVLSDFQKIGNGQIVLDYSVLKDNLTDAKIAEFFSAAQLNGIKIIADLRTGETASGFNSYKDTGFDGILYNASEGVLAVYDFALMSERKASVVEGYNDSDGLVKELQKTQDIKILNNSEVTSKIARDSRSMIDKIQILKILKSSALLGALKKDRYTRDFVKNSAYGFTKESLEEISKADTGEFMRLLQSNNIEALKKSLNLSESHPVMIYLGHIQDNVEDESEVLAVQGAFLEGIVEKLLASRTVFGAIVNKDLEKTLGKALRRQAQSGEKAAPSVSADKFKEESRQRAMARAEGMKEKDAARMISQSLQADLNSKVKSLTEEAFVNNNAVALSDIIELIPAIAELRLNMKINKDDVAAFDVRQVRGLLTAA